MTGNRRLQKEVQRGWNDNDGLKLLGDFSTLRYVWHVELSDFPNQPFGQDKIILRLIFSTSYPFKLPNVIFNSKFVIFLKEEFFKTPTTLGNVSVRKHL